MNILITGCSSGIGFELAISLAKQGHTVLATVLNEDEKKLFSNTSVIALILNLTDKQSIFDCVQQAIIHTQGKIDILINNAGIAIAGAIEDVGYDAIIYQLQVNVAGLSEITRLILPLMHKTGSGKIITISSMLGIAVFPYRGIYSASKYAVRAINDALRLEMKANKSPISVSLIESGPIKTNIRKNAIEFSKRFLNINESRYSKDYEILLAATTDEQSMLFIKPPAEIVKLVKKIIASNKPKAVYQFSIMPRMLSFFKNFLPINIFDKIILYMFSVETKVNVRH